MSHASHEKRVEDEQWIRQIANLRGGEVLVRFEPSVSNADQLTIALDAGATAIKRRFADRHALLQVPESTENTVIGALLKNPRIELAEPNFLGQAGFTPDDPLFPSQWHLEQTAGYDINASAGWDITRGNPGLVVAVLDSGVLKAQPEFSGRLFRNTDEEPDVADSVSGCSLATPIVSGIASLILSIDPSFQRDDILELLKRSAVDLGPPGHDPEFGWGRVDAAAALRLAVDSPAPGVIFSSGFE